MERYHSANLRRLGAKEDRLVLLGAFDPEPSLDVGLIDPVEFGQDTYAEVFARIE
ncbi:hypothetical protein [Aeromicrobium piscarium]|uniref:hypothetical protein n=1 Tax=Aeromicrobium piscarium TaxID=2590901 RepID=UPI00163D76AD|nr:hypothetical protein [Aeromicrobium piscarium]